MTPRGTAAAAAAARGVPAVHDALGTRQTAGFRMARRTGAGWSRRQRRRRDGGLVSRAPETREGDGRPLGASGRSPLHPDQRQCRPRPGARREVPAVGHSVSPGPGGAGGGDAGLSPIFEADLEPGPYAYRPGRGANNAVRRVHRLTTAHREVVDANLKNYFGEPAEIGRPSRERRPAVGVGQGVAGDAVEGGRRSGRSPPDEPCAARAEGYPARGTDFAGCPATSKMRRFIRGWKVLGYARRFGAEIVNYADDLAVLGKAPAAEMRSAVEGLLETAAGRARCRYRRGGWGHYPPDSPRGKERILKT